LPGTQGCAGLLLAIHEEGGAGCPSGPQWQHVLQYWEESVRRPARVLFLRYEEMLLEPEMHVRKLAKFMGCEFFEEEEEGGVVSGFVELC
jgi:hypothetical protein